MKTVAEVHEFWRNPGAGNLPTEYLEGSERSAFLVGLVSRYAAKDARILELGCNVGRNLHALAEAGFTKLSGVEISANAVALMRESYPDLASARVVVSPIESAVEWIVPDAFDLVYSMAVLEHVHAESEWIFPRMQRIARTIVTVEDEHGVSDRHWPRDYSTVFAGQVESASCADVPGLGPDFMARVFVR